MIGLENDAGELMGFASYGKFRERPAYKYTVEHSIYVDTRFRGQGLGRRAARRRSSAPRGKQDYHVHDRRHRRLQRREHQAAREPGLHALRHHRSSRASSSAAGWTWRSISAYSPRRPRRWTGKTRFRGGSLKSHLVVSRPALRAGGSPAHAESTVSFEWFEYTGRDATYVCSAAARRAASTIRFSRATTPTPASRASATSTTSSTPRSRTSPASRSTRARTSCTGGSSVTRSAIPAKLSFDGLGISRGVFAPSIHFHKGTTTSSTRWWKPAAISSSPRSNPAGPWSRSGVAQGNRRHRSVVLLRRRRQGVRPQQRAARRRAALQRSSRHLDPAVRRRG